MGNNGAVVRELLVGRKIIRKIPTVSTRVRHLLVDVGAIRNFAPFHVVEEESFLLFGVVKVPKCHRATDVKAVDVVAQFSDWLRSRVKEAACVQSIVTEE